MKNLTPVFVVIALIAQPVKLETQPVAALQPGLSSPAHNSYTLKRISFDAVHHRWSAKPRVRIRYWDSTSTNWSGYAVPLETSGVTDTFSEVVGTWTVPSVTGVVGKRTDTYSSAWVGLDGYTDGTVEQIGTEQDWTGSAQENYVWFEMYPNYAYEIGGFPASPGDSISAQVQYVGQSTVSVGRRKTQVESVFKLVITNNTKRVSYTVPASYTTIASAGRSSAEWVMEAPTSNEVLPLADFGLINFSTCEAASVKSSGRLSPINFWISDPMTMLDPEGGESVPSALSGNGQAFSATWLIN